MDLGFGTLPGGVSAGLVPKTTVSITDDDVPSVTVSFGSATYPVDEGDTETVTVTLSAAPEREVVVPIDTTDEDGASSDDYSLSATSVTFGPTDTSKTFTFTAIQDSVDDDGESVDLTFGSPLPEGVSTGSVPETTVTITDDDEPGVSISKTSLEIDEGASDTYDVELDTEPAGDVTVTIGGFTGADLTLDKDTLTFNEQNWDMPQRVTVTADHDGDAVDEEQVTLTHTVSATEGSDYDGLKAADVSVTITDDDEPGVSISKTSLEIDEGASDTYDVELDTEPAGDVTVTIGGFTGADLTLDKDTLTFNEQNWDMPQRVTVTADHDGDAVDEEQVTLTHTVSATEGSDYDGLKAADVSVTITDDDEPGVSISKTSLEIDEGASDTYDVELDTEPAGDVTVTIGGFTGADLTLDKDTLTFNEQNWDMPQRVTVTADHDADAVDEEQVTITHSVSSDDDTTYDDLRAGSIAVSITDDDDPVVTVNFEHSTYSVAESDDASTTSEKENEVTVTVTLDAEPERTVDITLILTNQGASDADYSLSATSVTFGPTDTSKTFTFTATQDTVDDDGESVKLTFDSQLPAGVSRGSVPETTVSITDDDAPSSLTVNFKKSGYTVTEGSIEEIVLTLDDDPERTVTIPLSWSNEDGASDSDHNGVPTDVTFNAGETEKSFEFSAASDRIGDQGETVSIKLGAPPSGVTKGTTSETVVTIEDVAPQGSTTVSFGADTYGVSEGSFTTITVVMSHAPGSDATIPIMATNQGDTSNSDYLLSATSVIFGPTDTSKTFTFTATQDSDDDDEESVDLGFGTLPTGISEGAPSETTVSITDDDVPAVEVSFEHSTYTVAESDDASTVDKRENEVTVKVTLSAEPERQVEIPLILTNQGASDDDYSGVPTSVTFGLTDIEKSFTFTATQDSVDDDGESVKLTFDSPLPDGVSAGTTDETTVSITDDDVPAVEVSFEHSSYTVAESDDASTTSEKENEVTVTVTLDAEPERTVEIPLILTNQGASDADYSLSATSVTFGPTETSKTFTFTATQDTVDDDGESVKLTFDSPLPGGVSTGTIDETTVSITDDDAPSSLTVNFKKSGYTVTEGSIEEMCSPWTTIRSGR